MLFLEVKFSDVQTLTCSLRCFYPPMSAWRVMLWCTFILYLIVIVLTFFHSVYERVVNGNKKICPWNHLARSLVNIMRVLYEGFLWEESWLFSHTESVMVFPFWDKIEERITEVFHSRTSHTTEEEWSCILHPIQ